MKNDTDQAWLSRRLSLEQGGHKVTPDGPIRYRKWLQIDPVARIFGQLLRFSGLHRRGVANALDIGLNPLAFTLPNLPAAFDGYRILYISDPHLDLLPELAGRMAALLSGVPADLLLLGGDYRDGHRTSPEPGLALLRPILDAVDTRDGCFAILGNHDPAAAVPILENMGARVLLNQTVSIKRDEDVLHLTGLDDVHTFYTDAARAALDETFDGCRIATVHSAEAADLAAAAGIDLYLCGHTHGGQIRLPWGHAPVKRLSRCREYGHGPWRHDQMTGYTSAGAGVSGIPIRYNCPPEVALITLHQPGSTLANPQAP